MNIDPTYNIDYQYQYSSKKKTFAMWLAEKHIPILYQYNHDPELQDIDGMTVAMIQAQNGKIPDKQWVHNKYLRCKYTDNQQQYYYYTVQNILQEKCIPVPTEWKYEPINYAEDNQALINVRSGLTPCDGDPSYQNKDGYTVAMYLAYHKITPPRQWHHDPKLKNKYGWTVAMFLREKGISVPPEWSD